MHSLYGSGHVRAKQVRESLCMPGERNQVVLTPESIIEGLLKFWPEGVAYDPCWGPGSIVPAERRTDRRGLLDPWPHRTYCNPPYGKSLRDPKKVEWQYIAEQVLRQRAEEEKRRTGKKPRIRWSKGLPVKKAGLRDWLSMQDVAAGESIMLVPNRTNRKWYRQWRNTRDAVVELDPLAFLGQDADAPFTLALGLSIQTGYYPEGIRLRRCQDFMLCFKHVGSPVPLVQSYQGAI